MDQVPVSALSYIMSEVYLTMLDLDFHKCKVGIIPALTQPVCDKVLISWCMESV